MRVNSRLTSRVRVRSEIRVSRVRVSWETGLVRVSLGVPTVYKCALWGSWKL